MRQYKVLNRQLFESDGYSIVPIRFEDRLDIMKWRNEQIYHLRQAKPLTEEDQNAYFENVVAKLFDQEQPNQILFSFLKGEECIGYGGLVHINWIDKNAEISFVMNSALEREYFKTYWQKFISLIEMVAVEELKLHKIFTYAFDLRPKLYEALEKSGLKQEAILSDHCFFEDKFIDVIIHSKILTHNLVLRTVENEDIDLLFKWANDKTVRQNALNTGEIFWEDHEKWFKSKIKNKDCRIFILEKSNIPIAQIRFDLRNDTWEIDYSVDSQFRGLGLGKKIVELATREFPKGTILKGLVKINNIASCKVFETTGFNKVSEDDLFKTYLKRI
jgi:RimJ/RimL family protein N-acetyltransferase